MKMKRIIWAFALLFSVQSHAGLFGYSVISEGHNGSYRIDPNTAAITKSIETKHNRSGLGYTYNPNNGNFYTMDWWLAGISTVHPFTGVTQDVGRFEYNSAVDDFAGIGGLTYDPFRQRLYTLSNDLFLSHDLQTNTTVMTTTNLGRIGTTDMGMAFDPLNDIVYMTNAGSLYSLDPETAQGSLIGDFGGNMKIESLAFDPINEVLYGAHSSLFTLDVNTGAATEIGRIGGTDKYTYIDGLAYAYTLDSITEVDVPAPSGLAALSLATFGLFARRKLLQSS